MIRDETFANSELESITFSKSIQQIGTDAFANAKIKDVYFKGDAVSWDAIDIMEGNAGLTSAKLHITMEEGEE